MFTPAGMLFGQIADIRSNDRRISAKRHLTAAQQKRSLTAE